MKLKIGFMSSKELAKWFGISLKSYQNNRKRYQEKLKDYCKFDILYGGIIVREIFVYEYLKNANPRIDSNCLFLVDKHDGLMTVSGTAEEMQESRYNVSKSRDRLFGVIDKEIGNASTIGLAGIRAFVWAIKLEGVNNYRLLNQEEMEIFDNLIRKFYREINVEDVKAEWLLRKKAIKEGMSLKDYDSFIEGKGLNFYIDIIAEFKSLTGGQLVRATLHEVLESFESLGKSV